MVFGGSAAVSTAFRSDTSKKAGVAFEDLDRLGAEPASRFVDDAPKGLVGLAIVGHGREAKQGESVLDLGAGVEADIADEAVRDFRAHQGFLEGAREEVVAVEDGHLRPTGALPFSGDQRVGETRRLGVSVAKAHELDRSPLPFPGEQRLAEPRLVLGDDGVGGGEDMAGRAEILLEANVDRIREVASETADEGDVGAAPTVYVEWKMSSSCPMAGGCSPDAGECLAGPHRP